MNQVKTIDQSSNKEISELSGRDLICYKYVAFILIFNVFLNFLSILFIDGIKLEVVVFPSIIDLFLGITLLVKPSKVIATIIIARSIFALIVFSITFGSQEAYLFLFFQFTYASSIIFLLVKRPIKKVRNIVAGIAFTVLLSIAAVTMNTIFTLHNLDYFYSLQEKPVKTIKGSFWDYNVNIDADNWYLRDREAALKENPLIDQWAVNPKLDAHLMIIGEKLPPNTCLKLSQIKEVVLANLKKSSNHYKELDETVTKNKKYSGTIVHVKINIGGVDLEYLYGLYTVENMVFQVITFSHSKNFDSLENEFRQMINSFKYEGVIKKEKKIEA